MIPDAAAVSRIAKCREGIKEAGRKTPQTTVSKSGIRLLIFYEIEVDSQLIQGFLHHLVSGKVDEVVSESPSNEELHRHIINDLRIVPVYHVLSRDPVVDHDILYGKGNSLIYLKSGSLLKFLSVKALHIVLDLLLEGLF